MTSVQRFNALDGIVADRQQLLSIRSQAHRENEIAVVRRLDRVLKANPKAEEFELTIDPPAKPAPKLRFDSVPQEWLKYLEHHQEADTPGLGKGVSGKEVYDMISEKMLGMIEAATGKGGKKTWNAYGYAIPFNFVSKKRYRGVNAILLTEFQRLKNPFFMTFKQVSELKGKVKKGAKGHPVVYFTTLYSISQTGPIVEFATYNRQKMVEFVTKNLKKVKVPSGLSIDDFVDTHTIPILKYYKVFNGADIEGVDFDLDNFKVGLVGQSNDNDHLEIPEAIFSNYPSPAPSLSHGGDRAFYRPATDHIQMPEIEAFDTTEDYYRTLLHEVSHSTGHLNRLDRGIGFPFDSKEYAFEELVAEWGATFLSAEAGIIWHNDNNHAEYIKNWMGAIDHIKNDNKFVMRACTEAQKAADFVLQFDENGEPKYLAELRKKVDAGPKKKARKTTKKAARATKETTKKKPASKTSPRVSASVAAAVKDVISLPKFKGVSPLVGSLVFNHFRDLEQFDDENYVDLPENEIGILKKKSPIHQVFFDELHLTPEGFDFIQAVNGRLDSIRAQKYNHSLFPGLNVPASEILVIEPQEVSPQQPAQEDQPAVFPVPATDLTPVAAPAPEPQPAEPVRLPERTRDLMNMEFDDLEFDDGWENFMQNPARNLRLAVFGKPKNGKTAGSLALANYLASKFGRVLYNFADQGFNKSTQQLWIESGLVNNPNAEPTDVMTLAELEALCESGKFDFVFIDMISDYIAREKIRPHEFKDRFLKRFPNIGFVLVFEVTKSGDFKGDQGWMHIVDAVATVKDFLMEVRGRYGMGEYVVWEEGLRRFNPKKYDELFGQDSNVSAAESI